MAAFAGIEWRLAIPVPKINNTNATNFAAILKLFGGMRQNLIVDRFDLSRFQPFEFTSQPPNLVLQKVNSRFQFKKKPRGRACNDNYHCGLKCIHGFDVLFVQENGWRRGNPTTRASHIQLL